MADEWRVVSQRATERLTAAGRFEEVVEVTVETTRGTTKTFAVPAALYTAPYVKDVVDEWVARESAIADL